MTCERCRFRQPCVCAAIPTIATRTRVVIVRHHTEAYRSSNTGRLAHLALANSALVDHGGLGGPATLPSLAGAWLLFPEGEPLTERPADPPAQIVALDATWSQARRMFRKLAALRGLPILRLPELPMPAARFRESPGPGRVSTIEAIARALRLVEDEAPATALETLFAHVVQRAAESGRNALR